MTSEEFPRWRLHGIVHGQLRPSAIKVTHQFLRQTWDGPISFMGEDTQNRWKLIINDNVIGFGVAVPETLTGGVVETLEGSSLEGQQQARHMQSTV
jgi:hypothetical protein